MLQVLPLEDAKRMLLTFSQKKSDFSERVQLSACCGRVLAENVDSEEDLPAFDRSAVDGFAVVSRDTFGASAAQPSLLRLIGEVKMGERAQISIERESCVTVWTGGELPPGADAMVMLEEAEQLGGTVAVEHATAPGRHVVFRGDDVKKGELLLPAGTRVGARETGLFAALGVTEVTVKRRLRAGVLSTGDELIDPSETPLGGQIRDSNGAMLLAACQEAGIDARFFGRVPDDEAVLLSALEKAAGECDLLLLSGGSSAGAKDAAYRCLSKLGEPLFHGLALKPGKPAFAGRIGETIVVGLPGHPAAAYLVFHALVRPLIAALKNEPLAERTVRAMLTQAVPSNDGREELLPVCVCDEKAEPIAIKSGLISPLSRADGYIRIPRDAEGLPKGATVDVILF
ncbi:MAG: gephyrin-like molybdotransferase Glp [Christensenella sp.]|nr:gephyrin-like molybdotransferase Glp [Christensenella sp.]